MRGARRWVTIGSGVAAILVLAIGAPRLGSWAREEYYLRQLASSDPEAQTEALEELVAVRSLRALPLILDWLASESQPLELPGRFDRSIDGGEKYQRSWQGRLCSAVYALDFRAVPELIRRCLSEKPVDRRLGAYFLGYCGPWAVGAAPTLIPLLEDPAESVRVQAAQALGAFVCASLEVEKRISGWPLDPRSSFERRKMGAMVLTTMFARNVPASTSSLQKVLLARLEDPEPLVRRYVIEQGSEFFWIWSRDRWLGSLPRALEDPDSRVRDAARRRLSWQEQEEEQFQEVRRTFQGKPLGNPRDSR